MRFVSWRTGLAVALLVGACFTLSAAGAGAASSATRVITAAPRLPQSIRDLGAVRANATVSGAVVLRPRNEAALTKFIAALSDKHSPFFHHYLAPGQFLARFGPSPASIAAVTGQLRGDGLYVTVAPNGMLIHFRGAAAQVEHAFGTGLERVRLADGSLGRARTAAVRLPATIAGLVASVVGLDNVVKLQPHAIIPGRNANYPHAAAKTKTFPHPAGSPTPCSDAKTAASQYGGLTDDQIANAYGAFGLYGANDVGAGQHIAIFELEPFAASDIQAFNECYFGSTAATAMAGRLTTVSVDGGQPTGPDSGESLLDIEDVSAMAPGANIDVYEAPNSTFGAFDAYSAIVNDDVDQVVSTSWGLCEQTVQQEEPGMLEAENLLFQQAAAQGQSVFAAAGDNGSDTCQNFYTRGSGPVLTQDDPASQPYVVGVGGTTITNPTQPAAENVWNDGIYWGAGGGGISDAWPMPSWQLSSLVPGIHDAATIQAADSFEAGDIPQPGYAFCQTDNPAGANQTACREVPDVSAQADEFTGGITVYADEFGGWNTFGGTSSAAPIWAALLADTNVSATCRSNSATTNGVGFVSPLLYSVASNPTAYAASFNDVTTGNNDVYGYSGGLFPATTGYDMATGLGSPRLTGPSNAAGLAYYLCTAAAADTRPTVTNLSANIAFTSAASTTVTITGTNFESNATPDVASIQVGDYALQASAFTVNSATSISATFPAAAKVLPPGSATDGAGRIQVLVTLTDGESSAPGGGASFTYVDSAGGKSIPAVISVAPYGGLNAGGNTVIIYGAGFTGATGVKFGNRIAAFTVLHDWEIRATVPAYAGGTTVCTKDGSSYGTGEDATNDVCQTQVVVTNAHGSSTKSTILPLFEGDLFNLALGTSVATPAGEELTPAATEYDYFPAPTITSISTDSGPDFLASEFGESVVTLHGTGFNFAALASVSFGDPTQAVSQDFGVVTVTGTEIQIIAPQIPKPTTGTTTLPVTVQTISGQSGSVNATYAGIPDVTGVVASAGPTSGKPAGPSTGGTQIDVSGDGFTGQIEGIAFVDAQSPFSVGTQYHTTVNSDTDLTSATVPQNPGLVDVLVCTVTSCSQATRTSRFLLYPPGDPVIDSITPAKGPASGGSKVTITGENLGCATGVYFGHVAAKKVKNTRSFLDCGSTTEVTVVTPPGKKGRSVHVRVTTAEGDLTGSGPSTGNVMYTYNHSTAELLSVQIFHYGGRGTVSSSPRGVSHCANSCSHRFAQGATVTLTANAAHGSKFAGWGGACRGTGTCTVRMKGAKSVYARFVRSR